MTDHNRQAEFMNRFQALLEEFGAEISADDYYSRYAECGKDIRMTVSFADYSVGDIDLDTLVDPSSSWADA
jgi:hypothetical protein